MSVNPHPDNKVHYNAVQKNKSEFNDTITPFPAAKTVVDLFEEQVIKMPGNIALRWQNSEMSYDELNKRSNRLANYLLSFGITNGDAIGILVTRGPELIIALMAVLKAGATYIPIDPEYPADRQEYIITNSEVRLLLCNIDTELNNLAAGVRTISLNQLSCDDFSDQNPSVKINSHQLAYIIYTSGSTGNPKGVMIKHVSVVNLVLWVNSEFGIASHDRLMFITSVCFDLSVYDIFGMLASGGSIVIAEKTEILDLLHLSVLLQKHKVTFWDSVPSTLDFLIRSLESQENNYIQTDLRVVFLSGDWIPVNLPDRIKKFFPNAVVVSLGGATEATVWSNFYMVDKVDPSWKSIPYGKPMSNNFFYILDEKLVPVADGEQGELYIGGIGVARGYANDEAKTAYSFVDDPFNKELGGKMYRTGDNGRIMPDGNMEFLGRKDQQVKIRGFRVELGEIENVARQYEFVDQVIITANEINGLRRLAGYVIPKAKYRQADLLALLKAKLPDYMVPGLWMQLRQFPLNANGKIDRKALPDIEQTQAGDDHVAPRNSTETQLAEIWQNILGVGAISINDNFFDMGGQSLLAVSMIAEAEKVFRKKIGLNSIFKYPTVETFAGFLLSDKATDLFKSLVPIKATGTKPPLYIIHGDGYNFSNFINLGHYLDKQQPLYALQPLGLDSRDEPLDAIEKIAAHYVNEIVLHNPNGPYAILGYSFGGYVAVEMKRLLEAMGKTVGLLGIFDTDASALYYKKAGIRKFPKKLVRQFPKALFTIRSFVENPSGALSYQKKMVINKLEKLGFEFDKPDQELTETDINLLKINIKNELAVNNYHLKPFNGKLHLFKASERLYFVDENEWLGWKKFALDGVNVYNIQGDHKTMFVEPNVKDMARVLQNICDEHLKQ